MSDNVNIVEIFSSIQGEAKYVGARQLFVRFAGCNLRCAYCDTDESFQAPAQALVETHAGSREFLRLPNPLPLDELAQQLNRLLAEVPHHSISFTGGEPLLSAAAIGRLREMVSGRFFLETNGTLPDKLAAILPAVDIISMDIKLPDIVGKPLWAEHQEFLQLAADAGKDVFVKIVVSAGTAEADFRRAIDLIATVSKAIMLIIQPVTPSGSCQAIAPDKLLALQNMALQSLADVRVIPQTHKFINLL